jgi:hypothetical protein
MSSHTISKIFVIGGTGARGIPIVRAIVADKKYSVRFLSRDPASRRATALLALDNVSVLEGSFADEAILREGFRGCDGAFINIDGFNTGDRPTGARRLQRREDRRFLRPGLARSIRLCAFGLCFGDRQLREKLTAESGWFQRASEYGLSKPEIDFGALAELPDHRELCGTRLRCRCAPCGGAVAINVTVGSYTAPTADQIPV